MRDTMGPAGQYPRGKLGPDDLGALNVGIAHDKHGNVHINFGIEVKWIALPRAQAVAFARRILEHAGETVEEVET